MLEASIDLSREEIQQHKHEQKGPLFRQNPAEKVPNGPCACKEVVP